MMEKPALPTIIEAMEDPRLFGKFYEGESWFGWKCVLKAMYALPMTEEQVAFFKVVAGGRYPSPQRAREIVLAVARRGGKDAVVALISAYTALTFRPNGRVRSGERPLILLLAADRNQSRNLLRYIRGLFEAPPLAALITRETQDGFELANGIDIFVGTADWRSIRGRSILLCVMNELAFWRDDASANPDREVHRAIVPGTLTFGDEAMIVMISSVHRRTGLLYDKWSKGYGKNDPASLVVMGSTRQFNPTVDQKIIDDALADDPQAAAAEYESVWRDDLAGYITKPEIEACIDSGITIRPPQAGRAYLAWIDASSGSGADSMCCAVGHQETGDKIVVDCILEIRPPFLPTETCSTIASTLRSYFITRASADKWGLGFVANEFERHGIALDYTTKNSSEIFREALPVIRSKRCRLIDNERMANQFVNLERRTMAGGAEKIGHPERGGHHDDVCLVVAGLLVALSAPLSSGDRWNTFMHWQLHGVPDHVRRSYIHTDFDDVRTPGPEFGFKFSDEPTISLILPADIQSSHAILPSGKMAMVVLNATGKRVIDVSASDARSMVNAGTSDSAKWFAANQQLAQSLGRPVQPPGTNVLKVTDQPRSFSKVSATTESLTMLRRGLRR